MRTRTLTRALLAAALAACSGEPPVGPPPVAVPASLSMVTQPSASTANGAALPVQPAVRLRTADGAVAPVGGVPVTASVTSGNVVLAGASATTDGNGVATFTGLSLTGTVGAYTLRFTAPTLPAVDANPVTLTPGPAVKLGFATAPPVTARSGAALGPAPVVQLLDQSDNAATQAGVTVTATLVSGAPTVLNAVATTTASGQATFPQLILAGTVGPYTLRFSAPTLGSVDAAQPLQLTAGDPFALAITTQPATTVSNTTPLATQPVVQLRDAWGNTVPQAGVMVRASLVSGTPVLGGDSVATDATGAAGFTALQLTGLAGSYTLRFAATGLQPAIAAAPTAITAGVARRLTITTGLPSTAQSGVALAIQPVVQVADTSGNPVRQAGVLVTASFASVSPGASLGSGTATTDTLGAARFSGLTIAGPATVAGTLYLLRFTASALDSATTNPGVVMRPGPIALITFVTNPPVAGQAGVALSTQPVVQLRDAAGNAVADSGVRVQAALASGTGTVTNDSATSGNNGRAAFAGLAIRALVGSYTLRFTTAGANPLDAAPLVLSAGPAAGLAFVTPPPAGAQSGIPLTTQPVVRVVDVAGNPVSLANATVTAAAAGGGGTVAFGSAVTDGSGIASYVALTLSGLVGSHTLRFATGSLAPLDAAPLALSAGSPALLTLTTQPPAAAQSGIPFTTNVVAHLSDAALNPIANVPVSAGVAGGGAAVTNATATTDGFGNATFAGLTLTGPVEVYRLQFASPSLTVTAASLTTLSAGPPAGITVSTEPSANANSGVALATQPVVVVRDGAGNPVGGVTVTASTGAGVTVSGASAVTDTAGAATFTGLTLTGTVGSYTLGFAAGAAAAAAAGPTALGAGAPATVTIQQAPPGSTESGIAMTPAPSVLVRDASSNVVPGVAVTVAAVGTSPTLVGGLATTDAGGVATFGTLALGGVVGAHTLRFTAGSASADAPTSVTAGSAANIAVVQQPSPAAEVGVPFPQQPQVSITDGWTSPLANAVVTVELVTGSLTILNGLAVTDGTGIATFAGLSLVGVTGNYQLRFRMNALTADAAAATALGVGPATGLAIDTEPSATTANAQPLAIQPVVRVVDAGGNTVPSSSALITASLTAPAGAALANATATASAGVATFGGLTITGLVGGYRLRFAGVGAPVDAAAPTALGAGTAAGLAFTTPVPHQTLVGQALAPAPVVHLRDVSGNPVAAGGVAVDAGVVTGSPVLAGASVVTVGAGAATFGGLAVTNPAGVYRFRFTSGALPVLDAPDSTVVATPLASGTPVVNLTASVDGELRYGIVVPPGTTTLTVEISGGTTFDDPDLLVRFGAVPDVNRLLFDCGPGPGEGAGAHEICTFNNPTPGVWYVTVYAFLSFQNIQLTATLTP